MKDVLALKHLTVGLVLPMVGIDKGHKSSYLSSRPVDFHTSYP
uniref:Uncharacterized protein n=1 Tax=Peronospora matthiolae TaxID=2874970 RepID=A0AAV1UEM3_9STRA